MATEHKRTDRRNGTAPGTTYLVGHDFQIKVPDGAGDDPQMQRAEDEAVLADPQFQARVARARANKRAGKGIPAEDMDRYLAESVTS
jgi:hypothetical protein